MMKRILYVVLTALWCFSFLSCGSGNSGRRSEEVRRLSGRQIELCQPYKVYPESMASVFDKMWNSPLKIITYMENPPCTECIASTLVQWKEIMAEIDSDVPYIFVVMAESNMDEIKRVFAQAGIVPFVVYTGDSFKKTNSLDVLSVNRTMLLGKDNRILVVGEPFWDDSMTKLYKDCILEERRH